MNIYSLVIFVYPSIWSLSLLNNNLLFFILNVFEDVFEYNFLCLKLNFPSYCAYRLEKTHEYLCFRALFWIFPFCVVYYQGIKQQIYLFINLAANYKCTNLEINFTLLFKRTKKYLFYANCNWGKQSFFLCVSLYIFC